MEGAPEGSTGTANRSGWINFEMFIEVLKSKIYANFHRKTYCYLTITKVTLAWQQISMHKIMG